MKKRYDQFRYYMKEFRSYHLSTYAASASFFIITSILPLILLVLSIISWMDIDIDSGVIYGVSRLLPDALETFLTFLVFNIQNIGVTEFSISAIILIIAASKAMLGIVDGLNGIAKIEDNRNYFMKRTLCFVYMLILMTGMILTLGLRVFGFRILYFLQRYLPYVGNIFSIAMRFRGVFLYFFITLIINLIYSYLPSRRMSFLRQLPGALFSSAAWLIFSGCYSFYINLSSTSALYGSMGTAILAMFWIYFCVYIVFIGAVINHNLDKIIDRLLK